jgi:hypothetical protein
MASQSLRLFCLPDELARWLRTLCDSKSLDAILFRETMPSAGTIIDSPAAFCVPDDTYRIFLFPKFAAPDHPLGLNDVRAREWGWVDASPGRLVTTKTQEILILSEIHGEDFESEPVHPARYVRWLKGKLKGELARGVVGRDLVTGRETTYGNIYYSKDAEEFRRSGGVWKQFSDGNASFEPAGSGK